MLQPLLAALVLMASGIAAPADAPAAASPKPAVAAKAAPVDTDTVVCTYEPQLGTRFSRKVCLTRREREQRTRAGREALERAQVLGPSRTSPN
jgi:hypothetical protein